MQLYLHTYIFLFWKLVLCTISLVTRSSNPCGSKLISARKLLVFLLTQWSVAIHSLMQRENWDYAFLTELPHCSEHIVFWEKVDISQLQDIKYNSDFLIWEILGYAWDMKHEVWSMELGQMMCRIMTGYDTPSLWVQDTGDEGLYHISEMLRAVTCTISSFHQAQFLEKSYAKMLKVNTSRWIENVTRNVCGCGIILHFKDWI